MAYLIPIVLVIFGIGTKFIVELSAELSNEVFLDADAGIESAGVRISADRIVDMRPETSLGIDRTSAPEPRR